MTEFSLQALPWNILFGAGALGRLPAEMKVLGLDRALVLSTPGRETLGREVRELLDRRAVGLFAEARMHVPSSTLDEASRTARKLGAQCTVSVGGGSTTGLGKALAAREGLNYVAIPTTYSGSEMTAIWAVTESGRKVTRRDPAAVPALTLYDPQLTTSVPPRISASSGLNALAQAVANVATDRPNPFSMALGIEGIRALAAALPHVLREPEDLEARTEALYGTCLAAGSLGIGSTGLHHRLCHIFGGAFGTPHAETHAVLLPHSVAYNAAATQTGTRKVADAIGAADAASGIHDLADRLGAPTSLREIGVAEGDLDAVALMTARRGFHNPEPVTATRIRALLQNAFEGGPPHRSTGPAARPRTASRTTQ